jgi:hypothetical protein
MSFLDNLENNLKALESLEPGGLDDRQQREAARERALAAAPWAEKLKTGPYVQVLMRELTRLGFARRMKVNFIWMGTALRAEAREERLELEPTPNGVVAVLAGRRVPVDLEAKPDALVHEWIEILDRKKREQDSARQESDSEADEE